ncbi:MAG: nitrous oxide reductase accessory protein NosL [bacterium]|jgi:nitrous oxide reductase accessory protein NosL
MQKAKFYAVLIVAGLLAIQMAIAGFARVSPETQNGPSAAASGDDCEMHGDAAASSGDDGCGMDGGGCCGDGGSQVASAEMASSETSAQAREVANDECPMCSMSTEKTPTLVRYIAGEDDEVDFVSLECWIDYAKNEKIAFEKALVLDYSTLGAVEKMVKADKAFYVPLEALKFSMPPYLAAFAEKDKARKFAESKGSKVISFAEAKEMILDYQENEEDEGHAHHH